MNTVVDRCVYCGKRQWLKHIRFGRLDVAWGQAEHYGFHGFPHGNGLWVQVRWDPKPMKETKR